MKTPTVTITRNPDPRARQRLNTLIDRVIDRAPKPTPTPQSALSREDRMRAWLARNAPIATAQAEGRMTPIDIDPRGGTPKKAENWLLCEACALHGATAS
ncbi:hypothetical protein [Deinococcus sp. PEB2-63]